MHNNLYYPEKGCVKIYVTYLFKFLEISDSISETVQDTDIVAMVD